MRPRLIILDEPTRSIDVGAKSEIEALIRQFSENGISVLYISSELEELIRNCYRVVVIGTAGIQRNFAARRLRKRIS